MARECTTCRGAIRGLLLTVAAALGAACGPGDDATVQRVLLISIDTLRADHLGSYGYVRDSSPHMDRLADAGWLYEEAYAPVPRTGPSVAALLTGLFPSDVDLWAIPEERETLAEVFAAEGWATVAAVDNANLSTESGYDQGFAHYRETWEESDDEVARTHLITETAVERLQAFGDSGEPFFVWLHYVNPHTPYTPPASHHGRFLDDEHFDGSVHLPKIAGYVGGIRASSYLEGQHQLGYYVAEYDAEIAFADDEIGKVLSLVRDHPGLEDTLIVLTADHGEGLGEQDIYFKHGPQILESHVRVPLIVRDPRATDGPRRVSRPVSTIDVMPTILELSGIARETFSGNRTAFPLSGESLVPGEGASLASRRPDVFFASRNFWGIRTGAWKLILRTREGDEAPGPSHQLYDLSADPDELENLHARGGDDGERALRRLEARRSIQRQFGSEGADPSQRFEGLTPEALENLRALGYIR